MTMRLSFEKSVFLLPLLGIGLILSGCPTISSPKDWADNVVGSRFEDFLIGTEEMHSRDQKKESREELVRTHYLLKNGNAVYVDNVVLGRCNVHWEINPAGIIVGYRYEEVTKGGCNW